MVGLRRPSIVDILSDTHDDSIRGHKLLARDPVIKRGLGLSWVFEELETFDGKFEKRRISLNTHQRNYELHVFLSDSKSGATSVETQQKRKPPHAGLNPRVK